MSDHQNDTSPTDQPDPNPVASSETTDLATVTDAASYALSLSPGRLSSTNLEGLTLLILAESLAPTGEGKKDLRLALSCVQTLDTLGRRTHGSSGNAVDSISAAMQRAQKKAK